MTKINKLIGPALEGGFCDDHLSCESGLACYTTENKCYTSKWMILQCRRI